MLVLFAMLKLVIVLFNITNYSHPIIITEVNYAELQRQHLSSNIPYEGDITSGGMVEGSWSIADYGSHHAYECSGIPGTTDC